MPPASRALKTRATNKSAGAVRKSSQVAKEVEDWAKQFDTKLSKLTERQDAFLSSLEPRHARQD